MLFLKIVNMSISASWLVLVVLLLRIILKKAPKWINVLLWGFVAIRLACPISLESALSLVPSAETISTENMVDSAPAVHSGVTMIDNTVNPVLNQSFAPQPTNSVNPFQIYMAVLSVIWIVGIVVLLAYTAFSYWRLRRQVSTAVLIRDNVYWSESVAYPFVLGILWPKVYLPVKLKQPDIKYVVAHEYAHIQRRDYWWKPLGFLLLTIYWFNPLMWIAYVLFCRDIELACDEKVVRNMKRDDKASYAQALLNCSDPRKRMIACPVAFGEVGVKQRVKTVLRYKKPAFWIMFLAVIICLIVAVCFLTNPASDKEPGDDKVVSGIDEAGDSQQSIDRDEPDESQPIVGGDDNDDLQPVASGGESGNSQQPMDEDKQEESQQPASSVASEAPTPEIDTRTLFAQMPDTFYFRSGAGAWSTELYLAADGTFTGVYHDANMGDFDPELYPNGTESICEFVGAFAEPEIVSDYVCSTHVISLEYAPPEVVTYSDNTRYITATPHGLYNADEVLIYLPGYPVADLPEGVRGWLNSAEEFWNPDTRPSTLPFYVLSNVKDENAFFSKAQ